MKNGFSLVELSIVLVILGLLTGGILAGKSLIRASELRSVSSDLNRYKSATYSFRDKYFYLPGDMPNAVKFWGAQAGATTDGWDSTCAALTAAATGTATCNGDGDGIINQNSGNCNHSYERFRFWQHLSNAGMIEGRLSGTVNDATSFWTCRASIIAQNVPSSKIANAGFDMYNIFDLTGADRGNWLMFGAQYYYTPNSTYLELVGPALTAEEAWNIDTKMDDGKPYTGALRDYAVGAATACASAVSTSGAYSVSNTTVSCSFQYKM